MQHGYSRATWAGLRDGWAEILSGRLQRAPVRLSTYRLHRWIQRNAPALLEVVEPRLPPLLPIGEIARRECSSGGAQ
jgi:hypothetical protein